MLGLLKKKERRWTKCIGGDIQNAYFKRDFGEVKCRNQHRRPCTARVHVRRWSKSCDTSTQRRNPLNNFPVPFRHHFGTCPTWQLILASLQASLHAHTPRTQLQVRITPWHFDMLKIIWVKSGPLLCIHHPEFVSTLYVRLLMQLYNHWAWGRGDYKLRYIPNGSGIMKLVFSNCTRTPDVARCIVAVVWCLVDLLFFLYPNESWETRF